MKLTNKYFNSLIFSFTLLLLSTSYTQCHLFYESNGESRLLDWVAMAEKHIRIFIYPIPNITIHRESLLPKRKKIPYHYLVEEIFPNYLKTIQRYGHRYPRTDYRRSMIVDDPATANVFVIDHHWIMNGELYPNCSTFLETHLRPIIDNVVDNYPYLNRSNGRDHFMMSVHDNGAFSTSKLSHPVCLDRRKEEIFDEMKRVINRIRNISFITNSAHNSNCSSRKHWFDKILFCPDQDFPIPQLLHKDRLHEFNLPWLVNRRYDASYAGSIAGLDKQPLLNIDRSSYQDYYDPAKRTENVSMKLVYSDNFQKHSYTNFTDESYFSYNPCGIEHCWNMRLFDEMLTKTVPILSGNDIVMPFEKFINWRNISIKMTAETWHSESLENYNSTRVGRMIPLISFRARLRKEADLFRSNLFEFWKSIDVDPTKEVRMMPNYTNRTISTESQRFLIELQETLLWKKMESIQKAMSWFYFDKFVNDNIPDRHPFHLIVLEMWCRTTDYRSRNKLFLHDIASDICRRSPAVIADLEFFD